MGNLLPFIKLYRRHPGALALGILLALVTLLAGAGLLALSGWFISATAIAGLTAATALSFNFFTPGAGVRGFSIARTASRYFERLVSHDATFKLLAWLRSWFFSHLVPVPLHRIKQFRKGDLLHRLVSDVDALDQLYLRLFSPLLAAIFMTLLLSLGLSFFSPVLGLAVLVLMGCWLIILPALFYKLGKRGGQAIGRLQQELRQLSLDYLQGMAEVLIYGSEDQQLEQLRGKEQQLHLRQSGMAKLEGLGSALLTLATGTSALVMLYLAAGEYQNQIISGPVLVLSVFAVMAGFEALMPLPAAFQFLGLTTLAAGQLREVIDAPALEYGAVEQAIEGNIAFNDVCFSYAGQDVLDHINLQIAAGEHVALLGKTGCGKSTLAGLITRHNDCDSGTVAIDGIPVGELKESCLYGHIAAVPQKTHVLSASLRDNLRLARSDASDEKLLEVIRDTGLDSLAGMKETSRPLELWLGQGGVSLSGGEQRRLAIARVLLKQAAVLILDEPSEGLDPASEEKLLTRLVDAYQNRTLIMITHKQVLLERMDRVYRLDGGNLVLEKQAIA